MDVLCTLGKQRIQFYCGEIHGVIAVQENDPVKVVRKRLVEPTSGMKKCCNCYAQLDEEDTRDLALLQSMQYISQRRRRQGRYFSCKGCSYLSHRGPICTKVGRIITYPACSLCYAKEDLVPVDELIMKCNVGGRLPLTICKHCFDTGAVPPCSGAARKKNVVQATRQAKVTKKRQLDDAVKQGRMKGRRGQSCT